MKKFYQNPPTGGPSDGEDKKDSLPELRMDTVSLEWVVVAQERKNRLFGSEKKTIESANAIKECPFCNIEKRDETPILMLTKNSQKFKPRGNLPKDWSVIVVPNKFPIVYPQEGKGRMRIEEEIYRAMDAIGFHEVVILKNHQKQLWDLSSGELKQLIEAYVQRYKFLMEKPPVNHISIFHNSGVTAGASINHPHSQIITVPLFDQDLKNALRRSARYYKLKKRCLSCDMNSAEKKIGKRVVFENNAFIAFCPFASKTAFEVIISPKKHLPYFEKISTKEKDDLSQSLEVIFKKINRVLDGPDFNFYLRTAPCDNQDHGYYHWHWTILPKVELPAGFELSTHINVSIVSPEHAAAQLRKV